LNDLDIVPTADPTISSEAQRLARARAILDTSQMNPCPSGRIEGLRYYYEAIGVPNLDKLLPLQEVQQALQSPPPDPKLVQVQAQVIQMQEQSEHAHNKDMREQVEMEARVELIMAQVGLTKAQELKVIADAEGVEAWQNIESYKLISDRIKQETEAKLRAREIGAKNEGNSSGNESGGAKRVEEPPVNTEDIQVPEGNGGVEQGQSGEGFDLQQALDGADSISDSRSIGQNLRYGNADESASGI